MKQLNYYDYSFENDHQDVLIEYSDQNLILGCKTWFLTIYRVKGLPFRLHFVKANSCGKRTGKNSQMMFSSRYLRGFREALCA